MFPIPLTQLTMPVANAMQLVWDDTGAPLSYSTVSPAFDPISQRLWVVDGNRVLRIKSIADLSQPLRVDLVLGQISKTGNLCNQGRGETMPLATTLCGAYQARFDRLGNLYVVEGNYECHPNDRISVFTAADLAQATGLFPNTAARRVFNPDMDGNLTTPMRCGGTFFNRPFSFVSIAFDSKNRAVIANDGYYPDSSVRLWKQLYLYSDPVASQRPSHSIRLPMGAPGDVGFDKDDRLVVQDHTWPRTWVIDLDEKDAKGDFVWLEALPP